MQMVTAVAAAGVSLSAAMAQPPADASSSPPAEAAPEQAAAGASAPVPSAPAGILPVPDYGGDFRQRGFLTGDWGGARTELANKGVQFNVDWTQHVQGVASGGRDNETSYGGSLDYNLTFDLMRMGVMPLAFVKVRAESRYGDSINSEAGPILPVNTDFAFPLTDSLDEPIPFTITALSITKLFNPKFGVVLGKMDTLDGDPNEFASGRGTSQFMNANFVFNSTLALRLPYSTLGAGIVWMPTERITVTSIIMNTADSSTTSGFEKFGDGLTWNTEAHFQYRLGDLPGGMNVGALYSFDQEFAKLNSRFVFEPGAGLSAQDEDDTWAVYWSGWQYLWVRDPGERPIDVTNGVPDHQGVGLFARFGFADQDTNPVEWSFSGGIGGRGLIPSREHDTFGIGYFYTSLQTDRLSGLLGVEDHAQGFEAYYDLAITPAAHLTFDAQVADGITESIGTSVLLGVRLRVVF